MADLMHHNVLRVNALAVDDVDAMEIYREAGWRSGPHKDTDPDDPAEIPRVLPESEPETEPPAPKPRAKATRKPKES